jgi:hypothetical protein
MKKSWYTSIMFGEIAAIPAAFTIVGVVLFYVGLNMAHNNYNVSHLCSSEEGRLAQDVSGIITAQCSSASHQLIVGIVMGVVGAILAIFGSMFVKKGRAEFRAGRRSMAFATPGASSTAPYGTAPVGPPPTRAGYGAATAAEFSPGTVSVGSDSPPAPAAPKLRGGLAASPGRDAALPAPAPTPAASTSVPLDPGYGVPSVPATPSYSAPPPTPPAPAPPPTEASPPPAAPAPPKPHLKGRLAPPPGSDKA